MRLTENLFPGDLTDLVLPLISIDEFESKIDDQRIIVVAFFVFDKAPAEDLCAYIEKSNIATMDTEVSPATTSEGYYIVFVELKRGKKFPEELVDLVSQIDNLVTIKNWQFKVYQNSKIYKLTKSNLENHVELRVKNTKPTEKTHNKAADQHVDMKVLDKVKVTQDDVEPDVDEKASKEIDLSDDEETDKAAEKDVDEKQNPTKLSELANFLKDSNLTNISLVENKLYCCLFGKSLNFEIVDFSRHTSETLFESIDMLSNPKLNLGDSYLVLEAKNQDLVIFKNTTSLRLRPLTF